MPGPHRNTLRVKGEEPLSVPGGVWLKGSTALNAIVFTHSLRNNRTTFTEYVSHSVLGSYC